MLRFTNEKEFERQLKAAMKLAPEMAIDTLKKTGFDVLADLQDTTPEDTTRAKGGWNNVVDTTPSEWAPPKGPGPFPLQPFKHSGKIKEGSIINISNNVEYIVYLDEDHISNQAPMGIMNPVLTRAKLKLNALIQTLNRRRIL